MSTTSEVITNVVTTEESTPVDFGQEKKPLTRQQRIGRWFQIVTAIMLGTVAMATAWSGYQAARWNGRETSYYSQANALNIESTRDTTLASQYMLYDVDIFNQWLNAQSHGETSLANIVQKRFRAEFLPAFEAWLATNPFNNPNAPPGPLFMPQYKLSLQEKANQLQAQSENAFKRAEAYNQQSDDYVLVTVFFATALFLIAIAERFVWNWVRAIILVFALGMLLFGIYHLITYPII
jgi:hypothetical protein